MRRHLRARHTRVSERGDDTRHGHQAAGCHPPCAGISGPAAPPGEGRAPVLFSWVFDVRATGATRLGRRFRRDGRRQRARRRHISFVFLLASPVVNTVRPDVSPSQSPSKPVNGLQECRERAGEQASVFVAQGVSPTAANVFKGTTPEETDPTRPGTAGSPVISKFQARMPSFGHFSGSCVVWNHRFSGRVSGSVSVVFRSRLETDGRPCGTARRHVCRWHVAPEEAPRLHVRQ